MRPDATKAPGSVKIIEHAAPTYTIEAKTEDRDTIFYEDENL